MRYGIITDIHNNVTALRAVLKELERMECDRVFEKSKPGILEPEEVEPL